MTTVLLGALLLAAVPASAVVETVGGRQYGVEPQSSAAAAKPSTPLKYELGPVVHSSAPFAIYWDPETKYGAWEGLTAGFLEGAGGASGSLSNGFAVAAQYRDASGNAAYSSTFRGAYTAVDHFSSTENCKGEEDLCLSDAHIRAELAKYVLANGLPVGLNPSSGQTPIYFIFTPPGTTVCLGDGLGPATECSETGICSYHSFTEVNATKVLYAVLPETAKTSCQDGKSPLEEPNLTPADVVVNEIADEQIATVTDPLLTGWHDASGPKNEVPDKCRNEFELSKGTTPYKYNQTIAGVNYYINDVFDQAALTDHFPGNPCIHEVIVAPQFSVPNYPVHPGEVLTFNATASYVDLGIAKYNWEFGPGETAEVNCEGRTPTNGYKPAECTGSSGTGNPNSVASVVHKYTHSGTYEVKLTVIDDAGNPASVTHSITVPPTQQEEEEKAKRAAEEKAKREAEEKAKREAEEKAKREAEEKAKREAEEKAKREAEESTTRAAEENTKRALSAPVATAGVLSRSLKHVLASGLVVRYSVNQQVAGRFEVLLATSIARRIGLHGPPATGLAKGAAPQIVIGKAILVTTKGGGSTVKILFGKKTAARLHRLSRVSLMVRLVVRNASAKSPATSTVVSVVTLTH